MSPPYIVDNSQNDHENQDCPSDWRVKTDWSFRTLWQRVVGFAKEQAVLFESFWVAVMCHVLLFPFIWFVGWALPWPKSPNITTVIEINLENWPNDARPERIEELYNLKRSEVQKLR